MAPSLILKPTVSALKFKVEPAVFQVLKREKVTHRLKSMN